jgi:preprotein translocase subunit SecF
VGSYILGASTLREFGWALFVGLIVGAYSSLTIAAVTVIALKEREPRYREIRERLAARGVTSARMIEREDALLGAGAAAARSARGGVRREPTAAGAPPADPSAEERPPATPAPTGAIPPRPRKKKR